MSLADPNPVARVAGAPAAPAAAAGPAPAAPSRGVRVPTKTLLMGGAVLAVVVVALITSRRSGKAADDAGPASYEIDTTETDLYNDLQPELEQIGDQLGEIIGNQTPRPAPPVIKPPTRPGTPVPAPKPKPKPIPGYGIHTVQAGQTMGYLAAFYKTTPGLIYTANIKGRKRLDGTNGVLVTYADVKKGVRLVIPNAIKNRPRG